MPNVSKYKLPNTYVTSPLKMLRDFSLRNELKIYVLYLTIIDSMLRHVQFRLSSTVTHSKGPVKRLFWSLSQDFSYSFYKKIITSKSTQ